VVPPHRACIVGPFARIRSPSRTPRTCQAKNKPAVAYAVGVYGSGCVLGWCQAQGIASRFWQAFAPGWCNNRQVWPGANIHTSGRDQPERCRWRLGRLEGWGNKGGWTLPT